MHGLPPARLIITYIITPLCNRFQRLVILKEIIRIVSFLTVSCTSTYYVYNAMCVHPLISDITIKLKIGQFGQHITAKCYLTGKVLY